MRTKWRGTMLIALVAAMSLATASTLPAQEEDVPLVEGTTWNASDDDVKAAYIIGISNFLSIEVAWQMHKGNPPTDDQTLVQDFWNHCEEITLDETIDAIDDYYKDHPDEMNKAVIDVVWVVFVKPNLE